LLKTDDGFVPFPRFLELSKYLEVISNRGTIRPGAEFEGAIRATIDEMWTSAGQVPDAAKILSALKRQEKEAALQRAISEYEAFLTDIWGPTGKAQQENDRATSEVVTRVRAAAACRAGQVREVGHVGRHDGAVRRRPRSRRRRAAASAGGAAGVRHPGPSTRVVVRLRPITIKHC
jgi:hypothetical protein